MEQKTHVHGVLMLAIFLIYLFFGGIVFMLLEYNVAAIPNEFANYRIKKEWSNFIDELFKNLPEEDKKDFLTLHQKIAEINCDEPPKLDWNYFNSLFFSLTIATTIGYGNFYPTTAEGKIFCIIFAAFGIPIAGVMLIGIGKLFSDILLHLRQTLAIKHNVIYIMAFSVPWILILVVCPAYFFTELEPWDFLIAFYYCIITLTTIGLGDYVAGSHPIQFSWLYQLALILWIIIGLCFVSTTTSLLTEYMHDTFFQRAKDKVDYLLEKRNIKKEKEMKAGDLGDEQMKSENRAKRVKPTK